MGKILPPDQRREAFISKIKKTHAHLVLVGEFRTTNDDTAFLCRTHNVRFNTKPYRLTKSGVTVAGCSKCSKERMRSKKTLTHQDYCERISHLGIVPLEPYTHSQIRIKHRCICGNTFVTNPGSVLQYGCLCRDCGNQKISDYHRKSISDHQDRVDARHGSGIIKILRHGVSDSPSEFVCLVCKQEWVTRFSSVVNQGSGCPACATLLKKKGFSKSELIWLTDMEKFLDLRIRHAGNIGQYHIPGERFRVDGFCQERNTVFEFYGDAFHGNLNVYRRFETPNFFQPSVSTLRLHRRTMAREDRLRSLGYVVISIWEHDFKTCYTEWKAQLKTNL